MYAVIMAGGRGTRIASLNSAVPKPMIPLFGRPVLEYQLKVLAEQGFREIILAVGYLGESIREYFGDGNKFGVTISYLTEEEPLGTAGALYFLKDKISEDFLLLNGDIIFDVDLYKFYEHHKNNGAAATILVHPNSHPYDSGVIVADESNKVIQWLTKEEKRQWYKNQVNAGLHFLSPRVFTFFPTLQKKDLDRDILKKLLEKEELYCYSSPEYVKDMGTPDRFHEVENDILTGKVKGRNLKEKQAAIFLDRDGTVNKYKKYITKIDDFELIAHVAEAIKQINESKYMAIIITNQPVIARGECSMQQLQEIHNKMETLLGEQGAYIDDLFYCPHHPDRGFKGERPEFKVKCSCRKPAPGLLYMASEKYNIDLKQSYMIGDSVRDIEAGNAAGCQSFLLGKDYKDLNACIKDILERGAV